MTRSALCIVVIAQGACRGIDECGGEGSSSVEVGASTEGRGFTPWVDGGAVEPSAGSVGQSGV